MFKFFKRKKPTANAADKSPVETPAQEPVDISTVEIPKQESVDTLPTETPVQDTPAASVATQAEKSAESLVPDTDEIPESQTDTPVNDEAAQTLVESSDSEQPDQIDELLATDPVAEEQILADKPQDESAKQSWIGRLRQGLSRTGQNLGGLFVGVNVDESLFEELETALIMADAGIEATNKLISELRSQVRKKRLDTPEKLRLALQNILTEHLSILEKPFVIGESKPTVVMIAGVNGAGKTTSIGKLAHAMQQRQASVLLAAGDTFRAAAREQLLEWGKRNNVTVIAQEGGDPAAVAFDAVNAGRARGVDVVMVDTAGRLPTQLHLMQELKKIKRVINKADGSAPHETLLVVDGNTGQNVLAQIKAFDAAIELTGLIVTKLDGTAKGGTLAAVAAGSQGVRPIPVYWVGVGEGMLDLQPFVAAEFAQALLANDK